MTEQNKLSPVTTAVHDFMKLESASGILLLVAAIIAMLAANSPLADLYSALLDTTVAAQVGTLSINKPLLLWINDGLMAVFFFLIGLEIKREVMEGELSSISQIVLPGVGALGVVGAQILGYRARRLAGLGALAEERGDDRQSDSLAAVRNLRDPALHRACGPGDRCDVPRCTPRRRGALGAGRRGSPGRWIPGRRAGEPTRRSGDRGPPCDSLPRGH